MIPRRQNKEKGSGTKASLKNGCGDNARNKNKTYKVTLAPRHPSHLPCETRPHQLRSLTTNMVDSGLHVYRATFYKSPILLCTP